MTKIYTCFLLFSFLLLASCGVTSKYGLLSPYSGGWHEEYEPLLTEEDKEVLSKGKEVYLRYNPSTPEFSASGEVRVQPTSKENVFNFIEIGNWEKASVFRRTPSEAGYLKAEMLFDSLGNILTSKAYEKQHNQEKFYLREKLTFQEETIHGKLFHLLRVESYYETGELMSEGWQVLLDYQEPKSHLLKKTKPVKEWKEYSKDGSLISESIYDLEGKLLEKKKNRS
jgi:antitoxin component YwqK of YwqJK toxin-antitoxin module